MKRDLDLVRKILFAMEEDKSTEFLSYAPPKIEGYSEQQVNYHMKIMAQANLLHYERIEHETEHKFFGDQPPIKSQTITELYSISWHGHEFLNALRDDTRWNKVKAIMVKAGGFVTDIGFDIAKEIIKQAALKAVL